MPEENLEEKFKLSLLGLEKKVLDLEGLVNDLKKSLEAKNLEQRIEDIEDVLMATNLIIYDLKEKLEAIGFGKLFEKVDVEKLKDILERIEKLENELTTLKNLEIEVPFLKTNSEQFKDALGSLKKELVSFNSELNLIKEKFTEIFSETEKMKERIEKAEILVESMNQKFSELKNQEFAKVLNEISSLRNDLNKEILKLKENLDELKKASPTDLSILNSRLNSLKEDVEYLMNRKVEMDMILKNLEEKVSEVFEGKIVQEKLLKGLENFGKRVKTIEDKLKEIEKIYLRLSTLENSVEILKSLATREIPEEKFEKIGNKLNLLASKLNALEIWVESKKEKTPQINFEKIIQEKLNELKIDFANQINFFDFKIKEVESKISELKDVLKLGRFLLESESLNERIDEISRKLFDLEERIKNLEIGRKISKSFIIE